MPAPSSISAYSAPASKSARERARIGALRRRARIRVMAPDASLRHAVLDHVDARELVDLASALIRIPSFKTEETPVALLPRGLLSPARVRRRSSGDRGRAISDDRHAARHGRRGQPHAERPYRHQCADPALDARPLDAQPLGRPAVRPRRSEHEGGPRQHHHDRGGHSSIGRAARRGSGDRCVAGETQGGEGTHYLMDAASEPMPPWWPSPSAPTTS